MAEQGTVTVRGCVLDGDGTPVPDAMLEIWEPAVDNSLDGHFQRVFTDDRGAFVFVMHTDASAVVTVFMRGLLRHLFTRLYLPDRAHDNELLELVPAERRATLVARSTEDPNTFEWNIVMQGPSETVFFE